MGKFIKGDIVVINFPFSDLSGSKRRPALVVSDLEGDDVILCQITSRAKTDKYSIRIEANDYLNGKLPVESFIRPNKIFTADKKMILYTSCILNEKKHGDIVKAIIRIIIGKAAYFEYNSRKRTAGVVLHNNKIMFMQQIVESRLCNVFVGGRIEENETPEQAMYRELNEEANIEGKIIFGPVLFNTDYHSVYLFLIEIGSNQQPSLGYDPELPINKQDLKGIIWLDVQNDKDCFTAIDKKYVLLLLAYAAEQNIQADWIETLKKVVL